MTGAAITSSAIDIALPWWLPLSLLAWAVHMLVFHGLGLGFEWCDRSGALGRFKRRGSDRRPYAEMLPRVLINQCLILLPAMLATEKLGLAFTGAPHLGWVRFVVDLALMAIGHDVVQYAVHRGLLHRRRLRWLGHDLHHSTGASRSIGACYMSSADFFLEIVCPYLVPLVLIGGGGGDIAFQLLVPSIAAVGGLYEHSGYDFAPRRRGVLAWLPASVTSSHAHGEHHRRFRVSFSEGFGSPGLCDRLFGTRWDAR
jgi:sterol desaturase/sphingolipid hydroxylase (fatty acid hydroxylase superfamily)